MNEGGQNVGVDGTTNDGHASRARDGGQIQVAPSAAAVAREIETRSQLAADGVSIRAIIEAFPHIRPMMVAEAVRGLAATVQCWNAKAQCYEEKVDYAVRQKWVAWLAGYSDGLPVQTNMNVNASLGKAKGGEDMEGMLESPAVREEMRRQLDAADKRARDKTAKKNALPA